MSEGFEVESIRRLDVKPGETLVVKLGREQTEDRMESVVRAMQANVPDGVKVLVVAGDIDMSVIASSDADRIATAEVAE